MKKRYYIAVENLVRIEKNGDKKTKKIWVEVSREVYLAHHHFENRERYFQMEILPKWFEPVDYIGLNITDANWDKPKKNHAVFISPLTIEDIAPDVVDTLERKERLLQIIRAVNALPETQKRRFILHFFKQMDIGQIAESEQVSVRAIYKSLEKSKIHILNEVRTFMKQIMKVGQYLATFSL